MGTPYTVCFVTAGDEKTAASLAKGLVEDKLAACVSVVGNVSSTFRWEDKIETSKEYLLIIKTRKTLANDVQQFIKAKHPSKTPEVIFLDVSCGSMAYLNWMGANTLFTSNITKDKPGKLN
jgi:periplasmic divalent cation tolerance protein